MLEQKLVCFFGDNKSCWAWAVKLFTDVIHPDINKAGALVTVSPGRLLPWKYYTKLLVIDVTIFSLSNLGTSITKQCLIGRQRFETFFYGKTRDCQVSMQYGNIKNFIT
jgi:hypothetical protein